MAATTGGPKERFGTNWLSIRSRCSQSAPASLQRRTSSPRREKSLARIEGASRIAIGSVLHVLHELPILVHLDAHGARRSPGFDRAVDRLPAAIQLVDLFIPAPVVRDDDPQPAFPAAGLDLRRHVEGAVAVLGRAA